MKNKRPAVKFSMAVVSIVCSLALLLTGVAFAISACRRGGDSAVGAILTADQLMKKPAVFRRMLSDAKKKAAGERRT